MGEKFLGLRSGSFGEPGQGVGAAHGLPQPRREEPDLGEVLADVGQHSVGAWEVLAEAVGEDDVTNTRLRPDVLDGLRVEGVGSRSPRATLRSPVVSAMTTGSWRNGAWSGLRRRCGARGLGGMCGLRGRLSDLRDRGGGGAGARSPDALVPGGVPGGVPQRPTSHASRPPARVFITRRSLHNSS